MLRPEILHFTICMLPLSDDAKVEACRQVMRNIEPILQSEIKNRGENGKLRLEFDQPKYFGTPEETAVIFPTLKESGPQFELL